MPFPAALTRGSAALLEDQESLQGCSHPIPSHPCLPLSPRARACPVWCHSQRGCCSRMLLSHSFLYTLLIGVVWGRHWQGMVGHPSELILPGNLGCVLSQLHCSDGNISTDGLQALELKVPTRNLHPLSFNTWEPVTHHPPLTPSLWCLGDFPLLLLSPVW